MNINMTNSVKMNIATHAVKSLDSRQKQSGLRAELPDLGEKVFASHLLKKEYFAAPNNAALLPDARQEAVEANAMQNDEVGDFFPKIEDGRIKQVLLPFLNDYLSVTPTPSLNVINTLNKYALAIPYLYKQCVQPVGAATANHGDPICANRGHIKLVHNWIPKHQQVDLAQFNEPVILITARCENMNVSSSYVATGLPALTAIGGFIHTIERYTEMSLPFAFGIQQLSTQTRGRAKRGTATAIVAVNKDKPVIFTDEITTNAEIAFALKNTDPDLLGMVRNFAKQMNRFAGGTLWDINVTLTKSVADYFWYQSDNDPTPMSNIKVGDEVDYKQILDDETLVTYRNWEAENPIFSGFINSLAVNYRLIQSGYALLNEPVLDDMARSESKLHAWAESVFSLIELGNKPTFFQLTHKDNLFLWKEV